jgi:DsbC/DsbD-like thiol-disulfide interchange protein
MKISYRILAPLLLLLLAAAPLLAQLEAQGGAPSVSVAPIAPLEVKRGGKADLTIALQVNRGFHVNSHAPNDELLLPTVVHLDPPEGISIVNISYPEAEEIPFAGNEKLSVYSGSFAVTAEVRVPRSATGTQRVHGEVRYQACDNRRCFPPKSTPLQFDVKVVKPVVKHSIFTAASPHIH